MPQNIQLRIDSPCSQDWDRMSPEDQGRFCASCKKTVVDLTSMDDREVLDWLTRRQGSVCGRFSQDQLNRPLIASREKKDRQWRYWHYLVAGLLFSSKVPAQTSPVRAQVSLFQGERRFQVGDTTPIVSKSLLSETLRGRVLDGDGNPVAGASVMFSRSQGVSADADGYFSIPGNSLSGAHTLTISAVGYTRLQVDVNKLRSDGRQQPYPVVLMMQTATLGFVAVEVRRPKKHRLLADTLSLFKDSLAYAGLTQKALTVFPNPIARGSSLTLSVRLDRPGTYRVQLFSTSGALLETLEVDGGQKSKCVSMNIPAALPPGTYFVTLTHPEIKKFYTQQIVVF